MAGEPMAKVENAAVAIYINSRAAAKAVQRLGESGFPMGRVSVAARDERSSDRVTGYFEGSDGMKYWGRLEEFWGPLWGSLSGWAFFAVPGLGPVLVAGPLAGWIASILDNAAIFAGLTVIGAGLYNIGLPKESVLDCEAALRAGKYIVLVHGTGEQVGHAKQQLDLRAEKAPIGQDAPPLAARVAQRLLRFT